MADGRSPLLAESPAMRPVLEVIARVGPSDANVLVSGENGTGKSLVAQALHAVSPRTTRPMVTVNAGGMAEGVFESELFGHVRGAFTDAKADRVGRFELADGSTLFLDEIANVPSSQQAKLLRVIETGEFERVGSSRTRKVDVRIVSATNADLATPRSRPDASARTCCSASTRSRSCCRRCAIAAKTSRCWPATSSPSTRSGTARASPGSSRPRSNC